MQKCHAKRNLDLDLCDGFEWRGQSRLCDRHRKGREKGRNYSRGRRGEEGSHAGLLTPFYNYVEWKLRDTNSEYSRWPNTVFLYLCIISRYFQTALAIGQPKLAGAKSAKKDYILTCYIGLSTVAMVT